MVDKEFVEQEDKKVEDKTVLCPECNGTALKSYIKEYSKCYSCLCVEYNVPN